MENKIKNGAYIVYRQPFQIKDFFSKDFFKVFARFITQLATKEYSHSAIYFDGSIYEMVIKGARDVMIDGWLEEHKKMGLKIFYFNLKNDLNQNQIMMGKEFFKTQTGKSYSEWMAILSPIDNSIIKYKGNGTDCANLIRQIYEQMIVLAPRPNGAIDDPQELLTALNNAGLIEGGVRL